MLNFISPESSIQFQLNQHLPKYLLHASFHVREKSVCSKGALCALCTEKWEAYPLTGEMRQTHDAVKLEVKGHLSKSEHRGGKRNSRVSEESVPALTHQARTEPNAPPGVAKNT